MRPQPTQRTTDNKDMLTAGIVFREDHTNLLPNTKPSSLKVPFYIYTYTYTIHIHIYMS